MHARNEVFDTATDDPVTDRRVFLGPECPHGIQRVIRTTINPSREHAFVAPVNEIVVIPAIHRLQNFAPFACASEHRLPRLRHVISEAELVVDLTLFKPARGDVLLRQPHVLVQQRGISHAFSSVLLCCGLGLLGCL